MNDTTILRLQPPDADHLLGLAVILVSIALFYVQNRKKVTNNLLSYGPDVRLPPHVRSFLPWVGSALEMGRGIRKFIHKYATKFSQPIFTATIGSNHCLFIGDPDLCLMVYRYSMYLDNYALQKQFTHNVLGVDKTEVEGPLFSDTDDKTKEAQKQYKHYLFSSEELTKSVGAAQDIFQNLLPKLLSSSDGWCEHGLYHFVRECVFKASVASLVSRHVATDEAIKLFQSFDKGVPLLFGDAPSFLTKEARTSRDNLLRLIEEAKFVEEGSALIKARKTLGFPDEVFTRTGLGIVFAAVGNSIPGVFWCLARIIADENAYKSIRAEVEGIVRAREQRTDISDNQVFSLQELDQMLLLESAFTEALRVYKGAFTARDVVEDFVFDPKKPGQSKYLIEKGTRIMSFMATKHYDEGLFEDAEVYRFDRFAPTRGKDGKYQKPVFTKDGKTVIDPVRAFGGGSHLCPGRKFITYETRAFVAILLTKFEMRLSGDATIPNIDYSSQGVGVSHPTFDPMVEIRYR